MAHMTKLIQPICLYAPGIWGPYTLPISSDNACGKLEASMENIYCEKLNISFVRYILEVVTTYKHPSSSLLSEAFILYKTIPQTSRKIWGSSCEFLFNLIQVNVETPISKQKIKQIYSSHYMDFLKNKIKGEENLRVYKTFNIECSYLDTMDIKHRQP